MKQAKHLQSFLFSRSSEEAFIQGRLRTFEVPVQLLTSLHWGESLTRCDSHSLTTCLNICAEVHTPGALLRSAHLWEQRMSAEYVRNVEEELF